MPATGDAAVVQSESLAVRGLVRLIAALRTHLAEWFPEMEAP